MKKILPFLFLIFGALSVYSEEFVSSDGVTDSLINIASKKIDAHDFEEALQDLTKCEELERNKGNIQTPKFADIISGIGQLKVLTGNSEGFKEIQESIDITKSNFGAHSNEYKDVLNILFDLSIVNGRDDINKIGKELLSVIESLDGKNEEYSKLLSRLMEYNINSNQYEEGISFALDLLKIKEEVMGPSSPEYLEQLEYIPYCYELQGYASEAVTWSEKTLEVCKNIYGRESEKYIINLLYHASYLSSSGDFISALTSAQEALALCKAVLGDNHELYTSLLNNIALYNERIGNYQEGINIIHEAMKIKKERGDEPITFAVMLSNLALLYSDCGNYKDAVKFGEEAVDIIKENFGENDERYWTAVENLAEYKASLGNYSEAIILEEEILQLKKTALGEDNVNYAITLGNLAKNYATIGKYANAVGSATRAAEIRQKYLGEDHPYYALSLQDLAKFNSDLGDYEEAVRIQTKAVEIFKNTMGENHPSYATGLANLSFFYSGMGDYSEAIRLGTKASEIKRNILGETHPEYALSLSSLGRYYNAIGNREDCIKYYEKAFEIIRQSLRDHHPTVLTMMSFLADYNVNIKNYDEAIRICVDALEIEKNNSVEGNTTPVLLNTLAVAYFAKKAYEKALETQYKAVEAAKEKWGETHPTYAFYLGNLGYELCDKGDFKEGLEILYKVLDIQKESLGDSHPNSILTLRTIAECLYELDKMQDVENIAEDLNKIYSDYIRTIFSNLTSYERNTFYNTNKKWFETSIHQYASKFESSKLTSCGMNAALMSKGILLSSDSEFTSILKNSKNPEILGKHKELLDIRGIIAKLRENPNAMVDLELDSLLRVSDKIERELVMLSKEYGDLTRNMSITWQDVRNNLNPDDVAIEFVSFPEDEKYIYQAYIITSDSDSPAMFSLCSSEELADICSDDYYNNTRLSGLIWTKLEPFMKGRQNVYFSPVKELYNIALESLPYPQGDGIMSDYYNIYRLSSTRELAVSKEPASYAKAALYGGMKYDTDISYLQDDMDRHPELAERNRSTEGGRGNISLRIVQDLPGTEEEIDNIGNSMNHTEISANIYKGLEGSEASFKSLSGKQFNIMHIATHGFYWSESRANSSSSLSFLTAGNENSKRFEEDKALTRSGLLFSGANNALRGRELPDHVEDGILTAKEISELDFNGLDLVVLSACQTGLGEIRGDGVFGLQRGFKKAGANTLLMSLWKVDDEATRLLMTKFYESFLSGKTKYEALKEAQNYLRNYEGQTKMATSGNETIRPFQDPRYWAAFILLDALN